MMADLGYSIGNGRRCQKKANGLAFSRAELTNESVKAVAYGSSGRINTPRGRIIGDWGRSRRLHRFIAALALTAFFLMPMANAKEVASDLSSIASELHPSKLFDFVLPFGARVNGDPKVYGSAVLISDREIVTIGHNVMDNSTCTVEHETKDYLVLDTNRKIYIEKWMTDPEEACANDDDPILYGRLSKPIKTRSHIEAICIDTGVVDYPADIVAIGSAVGKSIQTIKTRRFISSGKYTGIDRKGYLKTTAFQVAGMSGGATVLRYRNRLYLLGVIKGEVYSGEAARAYRRGVPQLEIPRGKDSYGRTHPFFSVGDIPCKEF